MMTLGVAVAVALNLGAVVAFPGPDWAAGRLRDRRFCHGERCVVRRCRHQPTAEYIDWYAYVRQSAGVA